MHAALYRLPSYFPSLGGKPISNSRPRRLALILLLQTLFFPWAALLFASEGTPDHVTEFNLKTRQIAEIKEDLRLSENPDRGRSPLPPFLERAYDENRFEAVVESAAALSEGEKSPALFLLYGNALFFLGKEKEAVEAYQQAYRKAEAPQESAAALANFGMVFYRKGAWKEAAFWLERAAQIDRETRDQAALGADLFFLGAVYSQEGETEKGLEAYLEALRIAESLDDSRLQARALSALGGLHYAARLLDTAMDYHLRALYRYRRIAHLPGEAASLTHLGFILKDQKKFNQALTYQLEALGIHQRLHDPDAEANAFINIGLIYQDQKNFKAAIESVEKALQIKKRMGDLGGMAHTEGTLGTIYQTEGKFHEAIRHLEKARELFQKAGGSQQIHIVELRIQTIRDQMEE